MTRKAQIAKWGNSLAIRLPKPVAVAARLQQGDHLEFKVAAPGTIQIRAAKAKPTLAQLVRAITPENRHAKTDWGAPSGAELW